MSIPALVLNNTGQSVYITPEQSPTALNVHHSFANPAGLGGLDEKIGNKDEKPHTNGTLLTHQGNITGTSDLTKPPEVIPRPDHRVVSETTSSSQPPEVLPRSNNQDNHETTTTKKQPPQLPARPPSQSSSRLPKPRPNIATRGPPSPLRQRHTLPPPTIIEDPSESTEGGHRPLKYTREPHSLIAYLIPLPKPKLSKNRDHERDIPDRFLIYTPPQPHLLKPAKGSKESKKHWCKRKLQKEVQKAKKFDGKTFSLRGLHSKTTKGVMWAVHKIRATDIVFLGRINNKEVNEIVLVFPSSVTHTIPEVRTEFIDQVTRTKKKATKDAAISTVLLPITLVIDTLAALIWPFGGLFEIDAVWAYASIKGWNTSRIVTKRLGDRKSVFGKYGGTERDLFLQFQQDEKIEVLRRYLAEACHKKDPGIFDSAGVPPTELEVMKAIGWDPVVRGKYGDVRVEGETGWADEEWQQAMFKEDFRVTMEKGAGTWRRWCKKFEKSPKKALK